MSNYYNGLVSEFFIAHSENISKIILLNQGFFVLTLCNSLINKIKILIVGTVA